MSIPHGMRRAVAEVRWARDRGLIFWVGDRPLHDYWPMITASFRELLLPPQRRAEDELVTWSWIEPVNPKPLIRSELQSLRRALESAQHRFKENLARSAGIPAEEGKIRGPVNVELLGATLRDMVSQLVARPDVELATYLCRTEQGLRLHSWGAKAASRIRFPDSKGLEIAGRVLVGGRPGLHDVILESGDGEMLAETPSDTTGAFRFPKLVPGKYRLRARSTRGTFPANGLSVDLNQTSITNLVLEDRDAPMAAVSRGRRSARSRSRFLVPGALLAAVVAGGSWYAVNRKSTPESSLASAGVAAVDASVKVENVAGPAPEVRPPSPEAKNETANGPTTPSTDAGRTAVLAVATSTPTSLPSTPLADPVPPPSNPAGELGRHVTAAPAIGATNDVSHLAAAGPKVSESVAAAVTVAAPSETLVLQVNPSPDQSAVVAAPGLVVSPEAAPPIATGAGNDTVPPIIARAGPGVTPGTNGDTVSASLEPTTESPTVAARSRAESKEEPPERSDGARELSVRDVRPATTLAPAARVRAPTVRLTRTVRVRLAPWRVRLTEDSILPTQPIRAGQLDSVALVRQRMLAEQQARLPATLSRSEVLSGVRLELRPSPAVEPLAWRDDKGAVVIESRVENGRAEIIWTAAGAPVDGPMRLTGADGAVLAEVRYEVQTRELVVRTAEEINAWLRWVVRAVSEDETRSSGSEDSKPRFTWQTVTGESLSPTLHPSATLVSANDHVVDLPLGGAPGAVAIQNCALVDRVTAWSLVTEVRQAADRPLGL